MRTLRFGLIFLLLNPSRHPGSRRLDARALDQPVRKRIGGVLNFGYVPAVDELHGRHVDHGERLNDHCNFRPFGHVRGTVLGVALSADNRTGPMQAETILG